MLHQTSKLGCYADGYELHLTELQCMYVNQPLVWPNKELGLLCYFELLQAVYKLPILAT